MSATGARRRSTSAMPPWPIEAHTPEASPRAPRPEAPAATAHRTAAYARSTSSLNPPVALKPSISRLSTSRRARTPSSPSRRATVSAIVESYEADTSASTPSQSRITASAPRSAPVPECASKAPANPCASA